MKEPIYGLVRNICEELIYPCVYFGTIDECYDYLREKAKNNLYKGVYNLTEMRRTAIKNINLSRALKVRIKEDCALNAISKASTKDALLSYAKWLCKAYEIEMPTALLQMKKELQLRRVADLWFTAKGELLYTEIEFKFKTK